MRLSRCADLLECVNLARTTKESHPEAGVAGAGLPGVAGGKGPRERNFTPRLSETLAELSETPPGVARLRFPAAENVLLGFRFPRDYS
jgi:hypothetical protein